MSRKLLPRHKFSVQLIRAIKRSPERLVDLGASCGFTQPQLSRFSAGQSFTSRLKARVFTLAERLSVDPARSVVAVKVVR